MSTAATRPPGRRIVRRIAVWAGVLVGVPAVMVLIAIGVIAALVGVDGCEVRIEPTGAAGVRTAAEGTVSVVLGPCESRSFRSIRLLDAAGTVVWQADAPAPVDVEQVPVGRPGGPFTEVVPLAAPLEPIATYRVELSLLDPATAASTATTASTAATAATDSPAAGDGGASTTDAAVYALFGSAATFRPADLAPDRVWYEGRLVSTAEFERRDCDQASGAA